MIKLGTIVEITYPDYIKGLKGIIKFQETEKRWIVEVKSELFMFKNKSLLLSLEESDFKIIK
mgnify:CR=1 FL=1